MFFNSLLLFILAFILVFILPTQLKAIHPFAYLFPQTVEEWGWLIADTHIVEITGDVITQVNIEYTLKIGCNLYQGYFTITKAAFGIECINQFDEIGFASRPGQLYDFEIRISRKLRVTFVVERFKILLCVGLAANEIGSIEVCCIGAVVAVKVQYLVVEVLNDIQFLF